MKIKGRYAFLIINSIHKKENALGSVGKVPNKWKVGSMSDFCFKVRPLFKGVHYYLGLPLPAPTNQGGTLFKEIRYTNLHYVYVLESVLDVVLIF